MTYYYIYFSQASFVFVLFSNNRKSTKPAKDGERMKRNSSEPLLLKAPKLVA
jgi:hypothetical protein